MKIFTDQISTIIKSTHDKDHLISGCSVEHFLFLVSQYYNNSHKFIIFAPSSTRQLLSKFNQNHFFLWNIDLHNPTEQIINQESLLNLLFSFYESYINDKTNFFVLPWELSILKTPSLDFFKRHSITLELEEIISQTQLKEKLTAIGYKVGHLGALECGEFIFRGDICDIKTSGNNYYRLIFFDDLIEHIYSVDHETNRVVKDLRHLKITFIASWRVFLTPPFFSNLREQIPTPPAKFRLKFDSRKEILGQTLEGLLPLNFYFIPYLFREPLETIIQHFDFNQNLTMVFSSPEIQLPALESMFSLWNAQFDSQSEDENSSFFLNDFSKIFDTSHLKKISNKAGIHLSITKNNFSLGLWSDVLKILKSISQDQTKRSSKTDLLSFWMKEQIHSIQNVFFFYFNEEEKEHLKSLIANKWSYLNSNEKKLSWIQTTGISFSIYDELSQTLIISARDFIYSNKDKKSKQNKHVDLFAEHLSTLKEGDFIFHQTYGVGKFVEMQNMTVADQNSDFIVLKFLDGDKVYVPVYKMNLLEKLADETSNIKLSDLKTKKFEQEKVLARASAKKLAFDLLRLEAERKSHKGFAFSPPDELFEDFESSFEFEETADQARAISDVIEDMCKPVPMDRLICGDVGFGKTEVAMRAAFKAVLDKKQVVVLVPTTILCLQHYNNFKKRFLPFGVNIDHLSRLVTAKEANQVINRLKDGSCDIVISTHKVLSKNVVFNNLGLVIIDEEHRFGVGDKEKLKVLRSHIDFLTLTATPIPRTLQLAFLGIKHLSLIQTPPPERQSIQTLLIREDWDTITQSILKELKRGGQVFYIYNRVMDIEIMAHKIKEHVPKARLVIAHGQLNERELEKRIQGFYDKEFDILLATTIVESGIDIPIANTMIIHNAHQYGLAQLHQLRGRIGRSNSKAYCYFVIPNQHELTELSSKRLEALQKYCDIGAGFALANSDLEIRGAGELLGAGQSGHIQQIGLELYLSLLEEAMKEIKGETSTVNQTTDVNLGLSCYIPQNFINEEGARLKFYKKLSNASDVSFLESIQEEITDIYGPIPETLSHLILTLKIRILMKPLCMKQVSLTKSSLILRFDTSSLEKNPQLSQRLIQFFMSKPKTYSFSGSSQVNYKLSKELSPVEILDFCQNLKDQLITQ